MRKRTDRFESKRTENGLEKFGAFLQRNLRCRAKTLPLLLSGILLTGFLVMAVFDPVSTYREVAYAVDHDSKMQSDSVNVGLMGLVDGVASMEEYYEASLVKDLTNENEEVLVGIKGINRNVMNRNAFRAGAERAGAVGQAALQEIAENRMSYNDYYTLLEIVEAEATGGDLLSKLLVANVVLNRVEDSHFPDTVYDVVWQRVNGSAQFSPTQDGRISSCPISESTIEAVNLALEGEDNSQGALFFIARDSASLQNIDWFDSSLVLLFEYGGHEYYTFREYCE